MQSRITIFSRKPAKGCYSLERVVSAMYQHFSSDQSIRLITVPIGSRGIFRRLALICYCAIKGHATVNHIAGDIHFLTFGLPRKRTILTVHDCYHLETYSGFRRFLYKLLWFDIPLRRSAVVCAISNQTKQELIRHAPFVSNKIVIIPDCIPQAFFDSSAPTVPKDVPVLLQIGTGENKNVKRLIQAVAGIRCVLCLIGKLTNQYIDLLHGRGIEYINKVDLDDSALILEYQRCDLVTFISTYEGFGLPIVEANAIGRPVITSDIPPMRDIAGPAGHLVNPYSVESIRAGVIKVLSDTAYRERLIDAGRRNATQFAPNVVAKQYARLYTRLAAGVVS